MEQMNSVFFLLVLLCLCGSTVTALEVDKIGCPKTKGCYAFPEDCKSSLDCDYLVTYVPDGDYITFSMSAKNQYAALGFNDKSSMSGGDSIICFKPRIGVTMGHFPLIGHNKPIISQVFPAELIKPIAEVYEDGVIKCSFKRRKVPFPPMKYDLHQKVYLLFASGKLKDDDLLEHDWSDKSWKMLNVSTMLEVEGDEHVLLLAHAAMMFLAWIGFAFVGMFTARYTKSFWGERKVLKQSIWFLIHRVCMLATVLFTIVGMIIIFVHVGGWTESAGGHGVIGIFVIVIAMVQPILAFFRPGPEAYNRFMFTWAHRFIGLCGFLLALLNCFLGVSMVDEVSSKGFVILGIFLFFSALSVILYEVFLFHESKKLLAPFTVNVDPHDDNVQIETQNTADQGTPAVNKQNADILHKMAYLFIIVLAFFSCLAFVIVLALNYADL